MEIIPPNLDDPGFWIALPALLVVVGGIVLYTWLRPPAWKNLLDDRRYQQALTIYAATLRHEELTHDKRRQALADAIWHLIADHDIAPKEAESNMRLVVARYDRDQSYELRNEASTYEQEGAYDIALDYYNRAARWQEEHDPKDCQFLKRCAARVRRKVRCKSGRMQRRKQGAGG
jgi:tetratricopeptide (TPR) repeat protein